MSKWTSAAGRMAASFIAATPCAAAEVVANESDPSAWLKHVYALYESTETSADIGDKLGDQGLIAARASKAFSALLKKDQDCVVQAHAICALDWDFIIDGQARKLSNVNVGPTVTAGGKASVSATFKSLGASFRNDYAFVLEGGKWRLDDVVVTGGPQHRRSIVRLLEDYKY